MSSDLESTIPHIVQRRLLTAQRLPNVIATLKNNGVSSHLSPATCVYATGSVGRGEVSGQSDLDLFIVTGCDPKYTSCTKLDSIQLRAALIRAANENGFPQFSGDGEYLEIMNLEDILKNLGNAADDARNFFTARMLLLLESQLILNQDAYVFAIDKVIDEYWADYESHQHDFLPVYLTNDIIRYWKVLCLNYEANARDGGRSDPKRRLKNYKLKFSRILTCYSPLVYFCWLLNSQPAISKVDVRAMVQLSPVERLQNIASVPEFDATENIGKLLALYDQFLRNVDRPKDELISDFQFDSFNNERRAEAKAFGDEMFALLNGLGKATELLRYLVV